jgi:hypothetical protein
MILRYFDICRVMLIYHSIFKPIPGPCIVNFHRVEGRLDSWLTIYILDLLLIMDESKNVSINADER